MSVVFKVQGGHDVGMGHIYRSLCLADTLTECGIKVDSFFCNLDPISLKFIENRGYRVHPHRNSNYADEETMVQYLSENITGGLVLDQPTNEPVLLERLKATCNDDLFIVALDYIDMDEDRLDLIVNLYNHHPNLKAPNSKDVAYVEGPSYAIIRPAFDSFIARQKPIRQHSHDVLMSFGGGDSKGNTMQVLNALTDIKNGEICFHVVIGPNFLDRETIKLKADEFPIGKVRLYESVDDMEELMFSCDFGLHGGGTMMLEMASVGTPSIVLPQNGNEACFGAFFVEKDVVKMPGYVDELHQGQLAKIILELAVDSSERKRMSRAGKTLVDGKGRYRIAKLIHKGLREA